MSSENVQVEVESSAESETASESETESEADTPLKLDALAEEYTKTFSSDTCCHRFNLRKGNPQTSKYCTIHTPSQPNPNQAYYFGEDLT